MSADHGSPLLRLLAVVPTFDEADNVEPLCTALLAAAPAADVLFVDDRSPDGTAALVSRMAALEPRVHLLSRPGRRGLGSACREGFAWGLGRGYEAVATLDADLSHDPSHLPDLVAALDGHDLVIGSRYVPGGGVVGWGWHRRFLSRAANLTARRLLTPEVHDCTSGYRVYRASALATLPLDRIRSSGYSFLEEMTVLLLRHGGRVREVPITFVDRRGGRSKLSSREIWRAMYHLARLKAIGGRRRAEGGKRTLLSSSPP